MEVLFIVVVGAVVAVASGIRLYGPRGRFSEGDEEAVLAAIDRHAIRRDYLWGASALRLAPEGIAIRPVPSSDAPVVVIRRGAVEIRSRIPADDLREILQQQGFTEPLPRRARGHRRASACVSVPSSANARRLLRTALDVHRVLGSVTTAGVWKWSTQYPDFD